METRQPKWECVANIGDINPFRHGGSFVMVDSTGVYDPELWLFERCEYGDRYDKHVLLRRCTILMEPCHPTPSNPKCLGDNRHHPDHVCWFGEEKKLDQISSYVGLTADELRAKLCSADPVELAFGYEAVVSYYGAEEFTDWETLTAFQAWNHCRKLTAMLRKHRNKKGKK